MRSGEPELGKLFLLLPRMLLHKPPRGGLVPRKDLEERFADFAVGRWAQLFRASCEADVQASAQNGAKTQEGFHGRFVKASSESSFFRPEGGVSCQQPGKHWRELSWLLEHWPLWQPSPTPIEDLQHLANLWEEGSRNTSLSNVSSWTRNFSSSTSDSEEGCSSWSVRHDFRPPFSAIGK